MVVDVKLVKLCVFSLHTCFDGLLLRRFPVTGEQGREEALVGKFILVKLHLFLHRLEADPR